MKSGEKRLTQQQILAVALVVSTCMLFISSTLPKIIQPNLPQISASTTPDNSLVPSQTPVILSPTALKPSDTPIGISSPTIHPIQGFSGVNLPAGFRVGPWDDNFDICQNDTTSVVINGVEISGGFPPYEFSFRQYETGLNIFFKTRFPLESDYVQFDEPVVLKKGAYVHVEIRFEGINGVSFWADDLYYPSIMDSSLCPKP